jgi:hypothetical protein
MAKLSRKQIREGLEQIPIDTVLLGVNSPVSRLTHKQREFARLVALGETKSGAYREAYKSQGNTKVVAQRGYELGSRSDMQVVIDAYKLANEAARYRTPVQLRELVIHQLTQHALNTECPPAQRIKALELLGKVAEVAAFVDRKETIVVTQASDIRTQLLESLRNVVDAEDVTVKDADVDSLLDELSNGAENNGNPLPETHRTPTPLSDAEGDCCSIHTTPHERIGPQSTSHEQSPLESTQITPENKKDAEEDPTPSIWEDPPIGDETDSAGRDIFFENPSSDDGNLRQT